MADIIDIKKQQIREDKQAVGYLCDDELYSLIGIAKGAHGKSIKELSGMNWRQLTTEGYTDKEAIKLMTFFELARRLEAYTEDKKPKINSPEDVYRLLYPQLREQKKEYFITLCLDTKNQIISKEVVSIGSLNANVVHPREVFKAALLASAAHIVVSHNHPSGDPTPSKEDIEITKKLAETGKIMGINVIDHVIIGDGRHFSMKEAGHI
jgi:DNA repair protein RadC